MLRKVICVIAVAIILFNIVYLPIVNIASGNRAVKFSYTSDILQVLGIPNDRIVLVSLKNGSLIFIEGLEEKYKVETREYGIIWKMDYVKKKNIVVAGTTKGYLLIIDPLSYRIVDSIKIFDGPINFLDATNNGKYVVLTTTKPLVVSGTRVTAENLIIYDLDRRITVFYRDWNSKDKLAKVFKLKISDDDRYLVIEILDKFCELCEILEAKIEIYDLESLRKIYSKMLGLSVSLDIISGLRILSTRRRLRAQGYVTVVNIIEVNSKNEILEREFTLDFNSIDVLFLDRNKFFIKLSKPAGDIIGYIYSVKGYKVKNVKGENIELIKRIEKGVLGAGSWGVAIYDSNMNIKWSKKLSIKEKLNPLFVGTYGNEEYVYVAFRKILYIFPQVVKYNLQIEFYDVTNKKLSGVLVTVYNENGEIVAQGCSDLEGIFAWTLPSGVYRLAISLPGYLNQSHIINLWENLTLRFTLEKLKEAPINKVIIKVFNINKEPLENAVITVLFLNGTILYNYTIPKNGTILFLRDGKYVIMISAPNYEPQNRTISLPGTTLEKFELDFKRANLTICIYNVLYNNTILSIKGRYYRESINLSSSCITFNQIPLGKYEIYVSSGKLENVTEIYLSEEDKTIKIVFPTTETPLSNASFTSTQISVEEIVSFFSKNKFLITEPRNKAIFFKARDNYGNVIDLEEYRGKIIILDFFYTQCEGCKHVIPFLREINEKYGEEAVVFSITVSPSDTPNVIDAYINEHNITWMILHDDTGVYQKYNITIFPTVIIIGPNGEVAYRIEGSYLEVESSKEQLVLLISGVLAAVNQNPDYMVLLIGLILLAFAAVAQYYTSTFPEEEVIDEYEEDIIVRRGMGI